MEIIPVIDLLDGQVVRAQRGERHAYLPIESALCHSNEPQVVARKLLELYPFKTLYIADLNAIQRRDNHLTTIAAIRTAYPDINLWLDAGFSGMETCQPWLHLDLTLVVGSESLRDIDTLVEMRTQLGGEQLVLSLDWRADTPQGPAALFENADCWPQRVIVMPLSRVGSYSGPELDRLAQILRINQNRAIYAAGGVRNREDLQTLQTMGISGALLASTLHDKKISQAELAMLATAK